MMELLLSSQYINHEIEIKANISKSLKYNEYIRFICLKFSKVFTFYHFPSISSYQPVVPKTTGISNTKTDEQIEWYDSCYTFSRNE